MQFLCLAYGDAEPWLELSKEEQNELLAGDEALRKRGDMVEVLGAPIVVRAWDGTPTTTEGPFGLSRSPLVGFAMIEANNADEVVGLVANTPCARAKGAIEIRPIQNLQP